MILVVLRLWFRAHMYAYQGDYQSVMSEIIITVIEIRMWIIFMQFLLQLL